MVQSLVSISSTSEEVLGLSGDRTRGTTQVSISSTSEEVLGLYNFRSAAFPLERVSISSTSEEVLGRPQDVLLVVSVKFPLVQLPKKFQGQAGLIQGICQQFPLVQLPKKFQEGIIFLFLSSLFCFHQFSFRLCFSALHLVLLPSRGKVFPLVQLPKKFQELTYIVFGEQQTEFPLVQLPKKFQDVSLNLDDVLAFWFPLVQLPKKFQEKLTHNWCCKMYRFHQFNFRRSFRHYVRQPRGGRKHNQFPLVQLPKKFQVPANSAFRAA